MVCWGHWIWGSCRRWFHKPSCAKIELFQSAEPILIGSKGESVVHRGWKTHLTSLDMSERLDSDIRKLQRLKSPRPPNSISATSDIRCGREVLRKREGAQGAVIAPSFRRWNCFKFQACNQNAVFGWISSTFFCHSWSGGKRIHSGFILECVFTSLVAVTLPYHYHLCFLDVYSKSFQTIPSLKQTLKIGRIPKQNEISLPTTILHGLCYFQGMLRTI